MTNEILMKIKQIFLIVFFLTSISIPQKNVLPVKNEINLVLKDDFFNSASISISVFDLTIQKKIYEKNPAALSRPASNLKILTTLAGLFFLGADYNFTTALYYTGSVETGTLDGDLYVVGGFDPLFSSEDLDTLLIGLKQAGINNITGNIYADVSAKDSLFWGAGWMWDDDPTIDAPYLGSLNINKNSVKVAYKPGIIDSLIYAEIIPESDFTSFKNSAVTIAGDSSKIIVTRNWLTRGNEVKISGFLQYSAKPDTDEVNIYNPTGYFLSLLKSKLNENGINFSGNIDTASITQPVYLIGLYKRPFKNILTKLERESDNLSAEMTLYALAYKYSGKPASARNGIKLIDSLITLTGLDPGHYRIVDGSGVSHYNLVSSELMVEVLKFIYYQKPELFKAFYDSLPVSGMSGTLEKRMTTGFVKGNIHAKTGTLSGVSCLSGYIDAKIGHKLAFSIMIQNYVTKARVAQKFQDEICKILSEY